MTYNFAQRKIADKIYTSFGGKEKLSPTSRQIIEEALELAIDELEEELMNYPEDADVLSSVLAGKTRTYIKILSIKKSVPIVSYSEIPVSIESAKELNPEKIKLALIQIGLDDTAYSKIDTPTGVLYKLKNPSKVSKIISEAILKVSNDVHFVCLPECSIPFDETFLSKLSKVARERRLFIIAGSYHDFDSRSNTSLIITPSRERFTQYKIERSEEYGEGLKPRIYSVIKIFNIHLLRFAVLICSDISLDSVVNLFEARSMRCKGVDVVFNPSYTGALTRVHSDIRRFCTKTISYVAFINSGAGGSVIFAPKNLSEDHHLMCGEPLTTCSNLEVKIFEFEVNVKNLKQFRYATRNIQNPEDCFISPS